MYILVKKFVNCKKWKCVLYVLCKFVLASLFKVIKMKLDNTEEFFTGIFMHVFEQ